LRARARHAGKESIVQENRIGLRLASLRQPLRKALHTAAQAGVRGVEIDVRNELRAAEMPRSAVRQFRKILEDLNLRVCATAFPTRRGFAIAEDLDRRVQAAQAAMQFSYELGARDVILSVGPVPEEGSPSFSNLVDVLSALSNYADHVGTRLAALTDRHGAPELARLLEALPEQTLNLALHPACLIRISSSPAEIVERLGRYISYVYAADAVHDFSSGDILEAELGRGSADLPAVLASLAGLDYRGWVTIDRRHSPLSKDEAENAVKYLQVLFSSG
jgi:sugar phosphate isomerase/epimerase